MASLRLFVQSGRSLVTFVKHHNRFGVIWETNEIAAKMLLLFSEKLIYELQQIIRAN
jgi:hypothetical protein